jgi:hypothetical protein
LSSTINASNAVPEKFILVLNYSDSRLRSIAGSNCGLIGNACDVCLFLIIGVSAVKRGGLFVKMSQDETMWPWLLRLCVVYAK